MTEINNRKLCENCFSEISAEGACPYCGYNKAEFTPDPMVLPIGTKLNDKIVIGRVMGKGGFGITYLGYDTRMDKTIAVKEYYPNGISYRSPGATEVVVADTKSAEAFDNGAEKFYTEAEMVSQFNGNPNIVSVFDYFRANSTVYLLMEYLSGITLKNYVKKHGRLSDGQALYVMDKIAAALSITHSAGVLHRDISPDNIMICSDGKVKLIDFGAAREVLNEGSSNLTVVMKPGYTPIEQYTKKGKQGAWTDIYSLGVSMYYALTKVIIDDPYARMDSDEEFDENKYKINESLWVILKKCTMINASERYGSAIDLRKALRSVSAPLTAEAIELSPDDLKDEPEEPRTASTTQDDDFPATAMNTSSVAEEIETFETVMPEPSESDEPSNAIPAEPPKPDGNAETGKKPARSAKKTGMIAAICSAAAIIAVVVICVVAGLNKQKEPNITDPNVSSDIPQPGNSGSSSSNASSSSSTTSSQPDDIFYSPLYPEMKDGKLFFEMDSSYPYNGWGKEITKDNLLRFGGDIKITLEVEHLGSEYDGDSIKITDRDNNPLNVMAFNKGIDIGESRDEMAYWIFNEQTNFSFVLDRHSAEDMSGGIKLHVRNMFVKSAVLEAYDPSELEPGADAVTVNIDSREHNALSSFIPLETLTSFDSDVRVILDIEYESMDIEIRHFNAHLTPYSSSWQEVAIKVDNIAPLPWVDDRSFYQIGYKNFPDKFIFTIPKSELAKLDERGLCFFSSNLYIGKATVESVNKIEVKIDNEYPGAFRQSNSIIKTDLEQFGCDVKITLDLDLYEDSPDSYDNTYHMLVGAVDNYGNAVEISAYNMTVSDNDMYELGSNTEKFVFVLTEENIAAIGGGKLQFKVFNTIVKSAVIEKYDPEEREPSSDAVTIKLNDSYPGDWNGSELIPKSSLEAIGGDVKLTLYIEAAAASRESDDLKLWLNPVAVSEDWQWTQISTLSIGDNLTRASDSAGYCLGMREQSTPVPKIVTIVLPQSEISKMGKGMVLQTCCLYVKSAALERA